MCPWPDLVLEGMTLCNLTDRQDSILDTWSLERITFSRSNYKRELTRHRNRTGPHPSNLPHRVDLMFSHTSPPITRSCRAPGLRDGSAAGEGPRSCFVRSDQSYGVVSVLGVFRADPRYRRCRVEHQSRRTPQRRLLTLVVAACCCQS